jgi:tellurite resistance-related uncharacterized protein
MADKQTRQPPLPPSLVRLLQEHPKGVAWAQYLKDEFPRWMDEVHRGRLPENAARLGDVNKDDVTSEQWKAAGVALQARFSSWRAKQEKRKSSTRRDLQDVPTAKRASLGEMPNAETNSGSILDAGGSAGHGGSAAAELPSDASAGAGGCAVKSSGGAYRHVTGNPARMDSSLSWSDDDIMDFEAFAKACLPNDILQGVITGGKHYADIGYVVEPGSPEWPDASENFKALHQLVQDDDKSKKGISDAHKRLAVKTYNTLLAMYRFTRSKECGQVFTAVNIGQEAQHLKSHAFGLIFDVDANPLAQGIHVDTRPMEGQCLFHLGSSAQATTRVYNGPTPTMAEFCQAANITEESLLERPLAMQWVPLCRWAFLPREFLELHSEPVAEKGVFGDVTIMGGAVPHAGPATETPRMMGFCAVGGTSAHSSTFQANAWVIAAMVRSRNILRVTADYWQHTPSGYFTHGHFRNAVARQEKALRKAYQSCSQPLAEDSSVFQDLLQASPTGYEPVQPVT